jgi:Leucine-rich repeat (LRR) protein
LTKLRSLMVDKNELSSLPDDFFRLQPHGTNPLGFLNLATLNFEGNQLQTIPAGLGLCQNLVRVNLYSNQLRKIDCRDLPIVLTDLTIAQNPLEDPVDLLPFDNLVALSLPFKIAKTSSLPEHLVPFLESVEHNSIEFRR